ncbi:MAG: hypothetical protein HGA45_07450 [Chloroflexales bacterium]|nr:hypothetical protein [Chloroflexales bacterium]
MRPHHRWQAGLGLALLIMVALPLTAPAARSSAGGALAQAGLSGVVNLPSGAPAVGAIVWYAPIPAGGVYDERDEQFGAITVSDGSFSITGIVTGTYGLVVEPPENTPQAGVLRGVTLQALSAPPATPPLTLPAAPKRIEGTVTLGGTPTSGVQVLAYGPSSIWPRSATSGADGRFAVGVEGGTWEVAPAVGPGSTYGYDGPPSTVRFAEGSTVETATVTLTLASLSATITGSITDASGAPVEGITVEVASVESSRFASYTTYFDGLYSIPVSPGVWEVRVLPDLSRGYTPALPVATVEVADSQTITQSFTLLSGAVVDGSFLVDGDPATDVQGTVYAWDSAGDLVATSYAEGGSFSLVLTTGAYSLGVDLAPGSGYTTAGEVGLTIPPPTSTLQVIPVSLPLSANSAAIAGFLRLGSGEALSGVLATVIAIPDSPDAAPQWAEVEDATGAYSLSVTPGTWALSVAIDGEELYVAPVDPIIVTVGADETATKDLPMLTRDGVIAGEVRDEQGNPLGGQIVWVSNDLFEDQTVTGADGSFRFAVPLRNGANTLYELGGDFTCDTAEACYLDSLPEGIMAGPPASGSGLAEIEVRQIEARRATGGATLVGEVNNDGRKTSGASVLVINQGGIAFRPTSDDTDGAGAFSFALAYGAGQSRLSGELSISVGRKKVIYRIRRLSLPASASAGVALAQSTLPTVTVDLASVTGMPEPIVETFKPSLGWSTVLSDGTRIQIPPGAVPLRASEEDSARVVVAPALALPGTAQYREAATYGLSIAITVVSNNRPITERLAIPARVVLPYRLDDLDQNGATPSSARPAVYSGDLWRVADNYQLDQATRTYSFQATTMGTWALVRPQSACSGCTFLPMLETAP